MAGYAELRARAGGAGASRGELMGIGAQLLHRGGRGRPAQAHGHPRPGHGRRRRAAGAPDRQGRAAASRCRPRARGTRPRSPRSWRRSWASRRTTIEVVHGDTDQTPFGLGTYGSRSTPVSGAAAAVAARRVRDKARVVAAAMLEVSAGRPGMGEGPLVRPRRPGPGPDDRRDRAGRPLRPRAAGRGRGPPGRELRLQPAEPDLPVRRLHLRGRRRPRHRKVKVRRFIAVDDCGVRINPMIVEGQVHGGLADGVGMALMEVIAFDTDGNCLGGSFMDYLLPTAMECPSWELGETVTPSPHHPIGAKGVGESATVGSPAGRGQRGHRRAQAVRGAARRHAADPGRRSGGPSRAARCAPIWPSRDRAEP